MTLIRRLHSTRGGSDKVYHLWVQTLQGGEGYNVMYANGRRSSGATSGNKPKNRAPIRAIATANRYLNELLQKKLDEGYHRWGECTLCGFVSDESSQLPRLEQARAKLIRRSLTQFSVGTRVELLRDVERYPDFIARKGSVGTVVINDRDEISVKMEKHLKGAEEWNNCINWVGRELRDLAGDLRVALPKPAQPTVRERRLALDLDI